MTAIVDTSVWIELFRDKSGRVQKWIEDEVGEQTILMPLPVRAELLQGCRGEDEWRKMLVRVSAFEHPTPTIETWDQAARIYFDLRQSGYTPRGTIDCLIAQSAIEANALLLHNDRDILAIASVRPLRHRPLHIKTGST